MKRERERDSEARDGWRGIKEKEVDKEKEKGGWRERQRKAQNGDTEVDG